jgi:hypothetical protein
MTGWEDFGIPLAATILGALIGIPTGLFLARSGRKREIIEKQKQLCNTLLTSLKKNLTLLNQIINGPEGLVDMSTIYYNLELEFWSVVASEIGSLNNPDLESEIENVYYELHHIARKIDMHFKSSFFVSDQEKRDELKAKTIAQIRIRKPEVETLIEKIEIAKKRLA